MEEGLSRAAGRNVTDFESRWQTAAAETRTLATAAITAVGVVVGEPCGKIVRRSGWAVIGALIINDLDIEVVPRIGITHSHYLRLLAQAGQVWIHGRTVLRPWQFDLLLGWVALVEVDYPRPRLLPADSSARSVADAEFNRTWLPSRVPSSL